MEEVIEKPNHATPNAVPRIVNGISGHLGQLVPRYVELGPNNACVPFSSMKHVVEYHALGLGQNHKIVIPNLVQVSRVIQNYLVQLLNFKVVYNNLIFITMAYFSLIASKKVV